MPAIYFCDVIGDGTSPVTAFRPNISGIYVLLMLHEGKGKAIVASPDTTLSGAGITKLVQGTTWANLRSNAISTNPTAPQLTAINTWLSNNNFSPITSEVTWAQIIHFIARQVNPAADINLTEVN